MDKSKYLQDIEYVETNRFKWHHEYSMAFETIIEENKDSLSKEQLQNLRAEAIAFRFMTRDTTKDDVGERIRPALTYEDGSMFPDPSKLTDEMLDYYKKRLAECKNPVMKLRYADILWEKDNREKNKIAIGKELISAAVKSSNAFDHDNELNRVDCLNRALQVGLSLGKTNSTLVQTVTDAILERLKKLKEENNIRFTLELIETIIKFKNQFKNDDFVLCKDICAVAIKHYKEDNDNFTLRGAFVQKSYELDKIMSATSYDPKAAARDYAQTRIDEADKRTDSAIVQQSFLREAHKILRDAGLNSEAAKISKQIESLGKDEHFNEQFKEISFTTEIKKEEIDKLLAFLKRHEDTAAVMAISPNFISLWSEAEKTAAKDKTTYISDMFSRTRYDDKGMAISFSGEDDRDAKTLRYYQTSTEFKVTILATMLKTMLEDESFTQANLNHQFEKIKHIDQPTWESVSHGLKLFFEGDYYSASLILTTQLEDFMYQLLPIMEVTQYITEKDGKTHSPKTMGWFLKEMRGALGDDVYQLCYYTLIDKSHHNLRNITGHGKTKVTNDNYLNCIRLIQLFSLLLVSINVQSKEDDSHKSS